MQAGRTLSKWLKSKGVWVLLAVIVIVSAALRLYDVQWDSGIMAHPDERSTVAFYAPTIEWPSSLSEALNPHQSPLNPFWDNFAQHRRSYTYGHFPLYLLVLVGNFLHLLAPLFSQLGSPWLMDFLAEANTVPGFLVIGRGIAALFDVGTVGLVFLIGRKLYGQWAGLLAATLSAFTVIQIQLAHFFAVDPISTMFVLLALYGAMRMAERDSTRDAVLTGMAVGLAVASKFSALPIILAPFVAVLVVGIRSEWEGRGVGATVMRLLLTCFVAFVSFGVTNPYVLLDFGAFFHAVVEEQGAMVRGLADMPFTRQYRGTLPYIYFIDQQIRWGMGWVLGLVGFAGLGWVIARAFLRRVQVGEIILLSWLIPYFGFTGLFLAKFMRYMSPVVPLLTVMGAGLLVSLWRWGARRDRFSVVVRVAASMLIALTLVTTIVWSLAFVNGVYGAEHPWVQASRWIYANVPDGSVLGLEHWDDNLPFGLPEDGASMGAHRYRVVELPMYENDTSMKYDLLKDRVRDADYIILASNRLYRTIPRLPQRYPMSTRYYESLFSGDLGFEKVAEFTAYPHLGPFVFADDDADESFTVYDHPKPIILQKVRDLSNAEWDDLLGGTWEEAVPGYVGRKTILTRLWGNSLELPAFLIPGGSPVQGKQEPKKSLLLDQPVDTLPVVDDYRWNRWASQSTVLAVAFWWLVVQIVGLLGWPLAFTVFRNLSDRGHILSKSLTLLVVAYLVWLPASYRLAQNSLPFILLAFGLVTILSLVLLWRDRDEVKRFWQDRWKLLLLNEILFSGAYLFFVGIRLLNPDLWQPWLGGEKFMDFAFLNATLKSAHFPPYDPYFAGGYLNYYYYGQYVVGLLVKLTGIMPTVAFNLIIPTVFALTVGNSFCLGYNLLAHDRWKKTAALATGLTAGAFVAIIGNLEGFFQLWRQFGNVSGSHFHSTLPGLESLVHGLGGVVKTFQGRALPTYNYWDPTRVIPYTINEFPYFSFLFADLHPHMINIPIALLFMALLLNILRRPDPATPVPAPLDERKAVFSLETPDFSTEAWEEGAGSHRAPETIHLFAGDEPRDVVRLGSPEAGAAIAPKRTVVRSRVSMNRRRGKSLWVWVMLPLVLGAMAVINTWDFPTYWGLAVLVFLFKGFWRRGRFNWLGTVLFSVVLGGLSLLLFWPFFAHYQAISVGLGLVDVKTDLGKFLAIWGMFLFVAGSFLFAMLASSGSRSGVVRVAGLFLRKWSLSPHLVMLYRSLVRKPTSGYLLTLFGMIAMLVAVMGLAIFGYGVIALLVLLLIPALLLLARREPEPAEQFAVMLALTALIVLIGCEIFYLKDFLGGGDWKRMNTLFKFYIQVWLLLGIACAAFLSWLMPLIAEWRHSVLRVGWSVVFVALLAAALVYPILGTGIRINDRFPGARPSIGTLDGMAFMTVGSYTWPDENNRIELKHDYEAIHWLQENLTGTPVIAEANLPYYREGGLRVSSMTGFPTLLGMHQSEQRYGEQVGERDGLGRELYNTPGMERALHIIDELHISYIYVGKLERTVYDQMGIEKFDRMAEDGTLGLVFENPEVKIFEVIRSSDST